VVGCCARWFRIIASVVVKATTGLWIICRASFHSSSRWGTPLKHRSNWVEVACSPSRLFTTSKPGFRKEPGFCFWCLPMQDHRTGRIVDHCVRFIKNSMPCDGVGSTRCCSFSSVPTPSEMKCGSPQVFLRPASFRQYLQQKPIASPHPQGLGSMCLLPPCGCRCSARVMRCEC